VVCTGTNDRRQRDQGGRPDHALGRDDGVDNPLQVGVAAGHHPGEHVAGTGDGVQLQHLGNGGQPLGHRVVPPGLTDLQGNKGGHLVPQRGRIHLGPVSGDHAALGHPLEPGLHGAAGDPEAARGLEHADPGLSREQPDQGHVQVVDAVSGHGVQKYQHVRLMNSQCD
jgi:hypothetical protein